MPLFVTKCSRNMMTTVRAMPMIRQMTAFWIKPAAMYTRKEMAAAVRA